MTIADIARLFNLPPGRSERNTALTIIRLLGFNPATHPSGNGVPIDERHHAYVVAYAIALFQTMRTEMALERRRMERYRTYQRNYKRAYRARAMP